MPKGRGKLVELLGSLSGQPAFVGSQGFELRGDGSQKGVKLA
jgi:hypothetical protein